MGVSSLTLVAGLLAVPILPQHPATAPVPQAPRDADGRSRKVDGLQLEARVRAVGTAGEPVPVRVAVVNDGTLEASVDWFSTDAFRVTPVVTTKDGTPVPYTRYGKVVLDADPTDPLAPDGSIREARIEPTGKVDLSVPNLALYYDLTLPGEYVLTVARRVTVQEGGKVRYVDLKTDPIPFQIKRP